ncbi:RNA-binding protein [Nocardioides sp. Soil777]|uniref:CGNR zinc finger domain-containing protein n=1 Tax=Nocardioides sp. Soil777 TaxID=1736409 RepID=UPI0007039768|nr:CGNR zinc finger domain-containing protein [Nocardioides sp. Soil777]KRF00131.1 RNA-binding protein [Nocardioides sp. Soil777]
MVFAPDTAEALEAAVILANSALEPDTLTTVEDLSAFYEGQGYSGSHRGDRAELDAVRAVRARLRVLLLADRDGAVGQVNEILADARAVPRLVRHDKLDWHIHAVDDDAPLAERVLVETAMAMVDVVRADEMGRLGVCAADDCDGLVLDLSRNRSRRYCSTTCGNREAVAAYRARQKA